MKYRQQIGISIDNKYVFVSSGEGPIICNQVLTKMKTLAGLEQPASLSATGMRKYIATTMQVSRLLVSPRRMSLKCGSYVIGLRPYVLSVLLPRYLFDDSLLSKPLTICSNVQYPATLG